MIRTDFSDETATKAKMAAEARAANTDKANVDDVARHEAGRGSELVAAISRRAFLRKALQGTASLAAASAATYAAATLSACAPDDDSSSGLISEGKESDGVTTVNVPASKVINAQDFEDAPYTDYLQLRFSTDLPLGSLIHQVDNDSALVLYPSAEQKNSREIAMIDLNNGSLVTIIKEPLDEGKNTVIYDARASRSRLIWVELDLGNNSWAVYVVGLSGNTPGEALKVDEGDIDYQPPMLAVNNNKVYWTVMPMATGAAYQEDSYLRAIEFEAGKADAEARPYNVLVSHGRMITNPLITGDVITVVPRVDTELVYYQLTSMDCANDRLQERVILPPSLAVSEAICINDRFAFCIERNYAYADGLSNFGTYFQLDNDEYLHFSRTPMSPVVMFKDSLMVKSIANVVGVDLLNKKTFVIELPDRCADFGETLVGWGLQDKVVTSSIRVIEGGGASEALVLRVFA